MAEEDPFNEFKNPSPHYKFETTPGGQRTLSAPNNSKRSLLDFHPYAERGLAIAREHRLRNRPHSVQGSGRKALFFDRHFSLTGVISFSPLHGVADFVVACVVAH